MKKVLIVSLAVMLMGNLIGCASMSEKEKGAIIGGASGAVLGGLIGNKAGNTAVGAILGAAVGGVAGAYIGNYMDKQAAEMERDLEGATVERVGEGIKITFDSGILFEVNSSELQSESRTNIDKLATILTKYPDTEVIVEGHTDSTGSREHNMDLSIRRAQSVSNDLATGKVHITRLHVMGYGPDQPVQSNRTNSGRQANRRVDLAIYANGKLKKKAESQIGG
jgi:outer membrane protein OmpA-like peptidoglycan-associated protein